MIKRTSFQRIQAQFPAPHGMKYAHIYLYICTYIYKNKYAYVYAEREERGEKRGRRGKEKTD